MQVVDVNGNMFGDGALEVTTSNGKPKVPVINTDITIGTTAIIGGTVGRVLFEGTGNVVQESSSLSFDDTAKAFTLSGNQNASTSLTISNTTSGTSAQTALLFNANTGIYKYSASTTAYKIFNANDFGHYNSALGDIAILNDVGGGRIKFSAGGSSTAQMTLFSTGNIGINTTTDAGFRLDVNGTSRFSGLTNFNADVVLNSNRLFIGANNGNLLLRIISTTNLQLFNNNAGATLFLNANGAVQIGSTNVTNWATFSASGHTIYGTTNTNFFSSGNIGVNTATDAGFKLDVTGTIRSNNTITGSNLVSVANILCGNILYGNGANSFWINATGGATFGNQANPVVSAQVEIVSTTKGFLPPRMTTTQKNAIATPAAGLQVFDTTLNALCTYDGTSWITPTTITPAALTKVDDTNVTLTLGGTPDTSLLQGVSLTLGWSGTLADSRIASAATWNAKQNAITLTTTGTSGAATLVGATLNIPQYSGGGGGQKGIHAPFTLVSGQIASSSLLVNGFSATASIANRLWAVPFYPTQSITTSNLFVNLTGGVAAAIGRILIYSELNGDPYEKLFESTNIDCSTAGVKTITTTFNFLQDTKYFICWHGSSNPNMTNIPITSLMMLPQRSSSILLAWSSIILSSIAIGSAPATWSGGVLTNTSAPFIGVTKA